MKTLYGFTDRYMWRLDNFFELSTVLHDVKSDFESGEDTARIEDIWKKEEAFSVSVDDLVDGDIVVTEVQFKHCTSDRIYWFCQSMNVTDILANMRSHQCCYLASCTLPDGTTYAFNPDHFYGHNRQMSKVCETSVCDFIDALMPYIWSGVDDEEEQPDSVCAKAHSLATCDMAIANVTKIIRTYGEDPVFSKALTALYKAREEIMVGGVPFGREAQSPDELYARASDIAFKTVPKTDDTPVDHSKNYQMKIDDRIVTVNDIRQHSRRCHCRKYQHKNHAIKCARKR